MSDKTRIFFFSLTVIAVLLFSAVGPSTVYADGGKPKGPPAPGGEKSHPSGSGIHHSKSPVDLRLVPGNTTVTVLDHNGNRLSLASQDAADAIVLATDPIWCPVNQAPTPGANDCTDVFDSFDALLTFLQTNNADPTYQQAGTIYVPKDIYAGSESSIDFNAYNLNTIRNFDLTLQGGLDSTNNTINSSDSTTFNVPILIGTNANPWGGSLTFNNIQIQNVADQTALTVVTNGNVVISNSNFSDNNTGADLKAGGSVTINNTKFNHNQKAGLIIDAGGNANLTHAGEVNLLDIAANNNGQFGANIKGTSSVAVMDSFFNGNVSYATAEGYGLQIVTAGKVALDGVNASNNYLFGASVSGSEVTMSNGIYDSNGSGSADNPVGQGLAINSGGKVTLQSIEADYNQLFGVDVQAKGAVNVSNSDFSSTQGHTITPQAETFFGYGLKVVTSDFVSLNGVTANFNNLWGASLDGTDIFINNSKFNDNTSPSIKFIDDTGLLVNSTGSVFINNTEANRNRLIGAEIHATGDVLIDNSFFQDNKGLTCNGDVDTVCPGLANIVVHGYGLNVFAGGDIIIGSAGSGGVTATGNFLFGAHLEGNNVSVTDSVFDNNSDGNGIAPTGRGLEIKSQNTVTLTNVEANNNQLFGANINAGGLVQVIGSDFSQNQYLINSPTTGLVNYGYGLNVVTSGNITIDSVTAMDNYLYGASLTGADVNISNSTFSHNINWSDNGWGLTINSTTGAVTLADVEASNNQTFGATIGANGLVTISNSVFSGNTQYSQANGYGLQVTTKNGISLDNVTATNNGTAGAKLNSGLAINVKNSDFSNTIFGYGLVITTGGDVTLDSVKSSNQKYDGVKVTGQCTQVYVINGMYTGNQQYGLDILNATYHPSGTQTFSSNFAGNVFQGPVSCP